MSNGTFTDFLSALLAFESGWDRERYDAGVIQDWQLDTWAGGAVAEFFPDYSSWGDLNSDEWQTMAYRSMNSLGFVGFQFGEALLIDLGYYDDNQFYGNGAATNTWDGSWTGKNGVTSLESFTTKQAQTVAIQEAFGLNLRIIENGLQNAGRDLSDFIGQTTGYTDGTGATVTVELTLTGLLAAAHLRGAYGTLNLLLGGAVSTDEYGTSILQYIAQFGGYDSPAAADMIAFYEDRKTGDEGMGTPDAGSGGGTDTGGTPDGTANVDQDSADVVLTWSYGAETQVTDFDPATDTIFVDWIPAANLDVTEASGSVVFSVPSNQQSLTLVGVTLAELTAVNFTILDDTAAQEILSLIGNTSPAPDPDPTPEPVPEPDPGPAPAPSPAPHDSGGAFENPAITKQNADVVVTWTWGSNPVVENFDPASDTIFVDWIGADALEISEVDGAVEIAVPSNNQSVTLQDVTLDMLAAQNIYALDVTVRDELATLINNHDGNNGHGDGHGHTHMHVAVGYDSPAQVVDGFMPAMGDVVEISANVAASDFEIFEESGDALGMTVRISITTDGVTTQTLFTGFGLEDLTMANFSVDDQSVLNEIASVLGQDVSTPETGGYTLTDDADGSNPAEVIGSTDAGGRVFKADSNADDLTDFDPATDQLDFGGTSVHGMIITKSPAGEIVIDSPWSDAAQIVQGVGFQDVTVDNFGVVGNEHFRQDMGGVISWEQGVGPRDADTIYIRSHEYGRAEVIDDFDPSTMKISFLYFGTRERLSVEDTDAGLVISTLPSGQSMTLTDVAKADLIPGLVEFHFDQVMEDNLETPFGFDQNDVTLVDRTVLLTPAAPAGASTDGFQIRTGDLTGGATESVDESGSSGDATDPMPTDPAPGGTVALGDGRDTVDINWNWGVQTRIEGFDSGTDRFDFNALSGDQIDIREVEGNLEIEVLGNGGNITTLIDIQAEDLNRANLEADANNPILDDSGLLFTQLIEIGFDQLA